MIFERIANACGPSRATLPSIRRTHASCKAPRLETPAARPTPPTDAELLQAGYRYALALTHRPADAEDLVQEAWLNLTRRYGRVDSRAVLFTVVRNLFIDQCRRRRVVQFTSLDAPDAPPSPATEPNEAGVKGDLDALLGTLRADEREVLFLHYHQGHTAEEIGQLRGQPRGTVLSLIHRAIAKLRVSATAARSSPSCNQWLLFFVTFP